LDRECYDFRMKVHLIFVAALVLVSCGGSNDGRNTPLEPVTVSGQIRDYKGGEKVIRGGGIQNEPIIGGISNTGQFTVTIPTSSRMSPSVIIQEYSRCQVGGSTPATNPLAFNTNDIFLKVYPTKDSPSTEGTLYQSTCGSTSCTLPEKNFRVRTIHVPQAVSVKNYTCTVPFRSAGDLNTTYNFNLDLKAGWNTFRFVEINLTADSQTLDVENYSGIAPDWNLSAPTITTPMSQHP
jgi:hypothetical protein